MNERRALGFGLSAVLLWSTVATAFKLTLAEFTPIQMLCIASIVSAIALTVICGVQGKLGQLSATFFSNPWYYLLLGLINPLAYYVILFKAYDLLPASQAQAINYSWAITLTLMAAVFLGQKIRGKDWLACGFSYVGVIVIATQGNLLGMEFESPLGVGLALLSTLLWAGYWILNTKNKADPVVGVLLGFLVAIPFAIGLSLYEGAGWQMISAKGWAAVTYVGLFEMGITFVLWLSALKSTQNTARISNLIFASPFISLMLLATIIGEEIHPSTLIGLVLIISGLVIQQVSWGKKTKAVNAS
ncbi:TPA: DMT family transporter [Vibrio alginolyticus]|jgi:drug/metabolite transporter (DMT)-like permease|uniref:DMT family transporter n=1 Tax=Vibrio TaxID=662 RepID=UPI00045F2D94|nr:MULTISPECIES: DMT family transporter [Vibrio]GAK16258.1 permease [Vibrio sp. JCM 19053]EGQ7649962.1 DMT family transporter [Vibrio alginolyticus]EGQ9213109.1 DMT family transporter [Vibrio alginolyticus]EGQ9234674.1 DMT family transporter [Vibrio alginolyticus]EIF2703388.1 DMT family transporter [Vibrio alginolyticus]